ncbi:MAG: hypothetical protein ACI965_000974 [Paraglaciecola sp.]|jgi:hypothetical protein
MKLITLKSLFICLSLYGVSSAYCAATEESLPGIFRGDAPSSTIEISYEDLDAILKASVVVTGQSTRKAASKNIAVTGTRLVRHSKRLTENEGNRFLFESFKNEQYRGLLTEIRSSLEKVPSEVPLKLLSKSEQLAYWLNLYNVTLLDELIQIYPKKNLQDLTEGKDPLFSRKLLNVAGERLSLNDIQHNILMPKFDAELLIIYGLYQGIIGGPNIRRSAYTGENVYRALKDNAYEFVNSNRGTYGSKNDVMSVSSFYRRNERYFPYFKRDVKKHILEYLQGSRMREKLADANKISANIDNWSISDVYGTTRHFGGSINNNSAALMDSVSAVPGIPGLGGGFGVANLGLAAGYMLGRTVNFGRFTPEQAQKLKSLDESRLLNPGQVTVTDFDAQYEKLEREEQAERERQASEKKEDLEFEYDDY